MGLMLRLKSVTYALNSLPNFSSPELKAQVSFSDRLSSLPVCPSVNFPIFNFSKTTEPISTKLGTKHPGVKGIQVCSYGEPFNSHKDNYWF